MSREIVRQLFESYSKREGFMNVYSDGENFIIGHDTDIGYHLLISPARQTLLQKARSDYEAFELVKSGAQFALRHRIVLPDDVNAFIADLMESDFSHPPKPRGKKEDFDFNWTLRLALWELSKSGHPPTRNDERTKTSSPCGIDIVLDVLDELNMGHDRDYQGVKKIWTRGNKKFGKP